MSLYIQQENQTLIWNAIIKTPLFQQWSNTIQDPSISYTWARQIIQQFYLQNQAKQLTVQELQQLNRETIAYMLQSLRQKSQEMSMQHGSIFGQSISQTFSPIQPHSASAFPKTKFEQVAVTRDFMMEQKQDEINREFENRQKEYSGMLKRGPVQEIDFRLATEADKPIENMEDLIREQMSRREYEIPVLPSQPLPLSNKSLDPEPEKSFTKKVHWSNELIGPSIDATDITEIKDMSENIPLEQQNNTFIQQFRDFMMEMRQEMRVIREELNVIKTQPSAQSTDNIIFTVE